MSELTIREQAGLPFRRCVGLVLNGLRFRLFRASVTVSIVVLAVAFLATIMGETLIGRNIGRSIGLLTQPRQAFLFWADHLSLPMDVAGVVERLRAFQPGSPQADALCAWGGCDEKTLSVLADLARREHLYIRFFDGLDDGIRRPVTGRLRGRELLKHLRDPDVWARLTRAMEEGTILPPGAERELREFLDAWESTEPLRARIAAGHSQAVARATQALGARPLLEVLAASDPALPGLLAEAGFNMSAGEHATVGEGARFALRAQRLDRLMSHSMLRQRFVFHFDLKDVGDLTGERFYRALASQSGSDWLIGQLRDLGIDAGMTADDLRETAQARLAQDRLAWVEAAVEESGSRGRGGIFGLSPRVVALIVVSLLVCVVGIVNAMLMSVTERFTEIATMKCLGATDGVVMANFMLEAGFQGVVGGCIGGVLGILLGVLRGAWTFGSMALSHIPIIGLMATFGMIVVAGVLLSVVAAVYPAWLAARLSPMEAMRVE